MIFEAPEVRNELEWIAVDFDHTIAYSEPPDYIPRHPMNDCRRKLDELVAHGYKIVVHTARPWADYELVEAWLEHHDIPFRRIVCGKLLALQYVDDRNGPSVTAESWLPNRGVEDAPEKPQRAGATTAEHLGEAFRRAYR